MKRFQVKPAQLQLVVKSMIQDVRENAIEAARNTVNIQAAMARKAAVTNIENQLTLRNTFTVRSTTYTQCPRSAKKIKDIQAFVGALQKAHWLARQETGGWRTPQKGNRLAIPTDEARTGSSHAKPVKKSMRLSTVKVVKGKSKKRRSRKSNYVARAFIAQKHNLLLPYGAGLVKVSRFRKKKGDIQFKQTTMYFTNKEKTFTPSKPWLQPAIIKPAEQGQNIFNSQMDKLQ